MGQVSKFLRLSEDGYEHWCPGCGEVHAIPVPRWKFDGNVNCPTFTPSINYVGCCHYNLTAGILHFHPDCAHAMRHSKVPLPPLPDWLCDPDWLPRRRGPRPGWGAHLN